MYNLKDKVILVTGASKGIGAKLAVSMAANGGKMIVNYSGDREGADAVVKKITDAGGAAIALQADVSKPADVKKMFDDAISHFGKIDVLVNNAGIMITKLIKDTTDEDFTRQFDTNVRGVFNTLREAATKLADKGSIINFSTTNNRLIMATYATYDASKAAVQQLTRIFTKEIGRGINVNSVSPGPINTELFVRGKSPEMLAHLASLTPFNRIGEPEDVINTVIFLATDDAKWINAQDIGINGGLA